MNGRSTASQMSSTFTPLRLGYAFVDAFSVHHSPPACQVNKNINSPVFNPSKNAFWNAARKANNEAAARQYLEQHGATGVLSRDDIDQVCNLWL